jgi:DNA-binding CsgD family transcriptional regulator
MKTDARRMAMLLDVACAASEADALSDLGSVALPLLARAFGATQTMLYGLGSEGRAEAHGGTFVEVFKTYAHEFMPRDPQQEALIRYNPPIARASRYVAMDPFRRSDVYRRGYLGFGVAHIVQCRLTGESYLAPGMVALALFRPPDQRDFTEEDELTIARLMPAFRAAARRGRRTAHTERARPVVESIVDATDPRPRLAVDTQGAILWISPRASSLFGGGIPEPLARAARRLALSRGARGKPNALEVHVDTESGEPVWAELHAARTASGTPFISVILNDYSVPNERLAALSAQARLTLAETKVLAVLSLGLSNREIARRLFISVETARTHIGRILRKLDARTRFEAIQTARGSSPSVNNE